MSPDGLALVAMLLILALMLCAYVLGLRAGRRNRLSVAEIEFVRAQIEAQFPMQYIRQFPAPVFQAIVDRRLRLVLMFSSDPLSWAGGRAIEANENAAKPFQER